MPVRRAQAVWEGTIQGGNGTVEVAQRDFPYSFSSRFEDGDGTNPEELLAAAHAGCFSMALSGALTRAEFPPTRIQTTAKVHIDKVDGGFAITKIELETAAEVPNIDEAQFQELANGAKENCPLSKVVKGGVEELTLVARLV